MNRAVLWWLMLLVLFVVYGLASWWLRSAQAADGTVMSPYSSEFITALGAAVVSILTALGGLLVVLMKMRDLTKHVNSKMDELGALKFESGAAAERVRASDQPPLPIAPPPPTSAEVAEESAEPSPMTPPKLTPAKKKAPKKKRP